jgi:sugar lactone lactonase YvrE
MVSQTVLGGSIRPSGIASDRQGNLYVSDFYTYRVHKITPNGTLSTIAGNGTRGFSGDGGPATSARLLFPLGLAVDEFGNLYVADTSLIRRVTPQGVISTIAGNGTSGFSGDGGLATAAQFNMLMDGRRGFGR